MELDEVPRRVLLSKSLSPQSTQRNSMQLSVLGVLGDERLLDCYLFIG
jgi:hypothetical protein